LLDVGANATPGARRGFQSGRNSGGFKQALPALLAPVPRRVGNSEYDGTKIVNFTLKELNRELFEEIENLKKWISERKQEIERRDLEFEPEILALNKLLDHVKNKSFTELSDEPRN